MTKRSRIYFNFKEAFRLTGTAAGRQKLSAMGVHPIGLTISGTYIPESQTHGYFIDKKGRIVGTSNVKPKRAPTLWVNQPDPQPTHTTVTIKFASPEVLNDATL